MALARLHGGPLDGQVLPLEEESDRLILPYSETQVVYAREGAAENTGEGDGPTTTDFRYVEVEDDLNPDTDGRDE